MKYYISISNESQGVNLCFLPYLCDFFEALEEAGAYLQTYAVDKQNQSKVLHEGQRGGGAGQAEVSCQNTGEKYKGYSQGNAEELYSAQCQTYTDNTGIKHNNVAYAVSGGEK